MSYAQQFLENPEAAKNLLEQTGYSTNQTFEAIACLGELCVLSVIIKQAFSNHKRGELLPHRFEVELNVGPLNLHRTQNVDLLAKLENCNVLIPIRDCRYRVMLSNMLNRLFLLSAESDTDSIRSRTTGISNKEMLESSLDKLEWEIVRNVHELIDLNYLQIEELETNLVPDGLVTTFSLGHELADTILQKGSKLKIKDLSRYLESIYGLSNALEEEVKRQRDLIRSFNTYPRSFVGRGTPPLVGSSWNHRPEFRSHPLIKKFLELIKNNHESLATLADKYEDYITEVMDGIQKLPRGIEECSLFSNKEGIPTIEELSNTWSNIEKKSKALSVQAKLVEGLISSIDTLFEQQP